MRYLNKFVVISFLIIAAISASLLINFVSSYREVRKENKVAARRNELNEYIISYGDSAVDNLYIATRAYMRHDTTICDSVIRLASRYALKRTELKNMYNLRYKK